MLPPKQLGVIGNKIAHVTWGAYPDKGGSALDDRMGFNLACRGASVHFKAPDRVHFAQTRCQHCQVPGPNAKHSGTVTCH